MVTATQPFTSPVGRLVQGDCYTPSDKDQQGALRVVKTGPRAGQPNPQYFIAVAFSKSDPAWPGFEQLLKGFGAAQWPALFPGGPYSPQQPRNFSWKISDGDGVDNNNRQNADKPGFAGCWVVSFTSSFAPKLWRLGAPGEFLDIVNEKGLIKRGHWVQVSGNLSSNENPTNPGIYVNLQQVLYCGIGEEIVTGPTAQQAFGAGPVALPPGAQPIGAAPMPSPGGHYAPPPTAGAPAAYAPPPPAAPIPAPAPVPAGPTMTAKAGTFTYAAMQAAGWTDAALIEQGYMIAAAPPPQAPVAPVAPPGVQSPVPAPYGAYHQPVAPVPAPVPVPAPAPPPTPAARIMTAKAGGATYESFVAAGWTDDALIVQGYMDGIPF